MYNVVCQCEYHVVCVLILHCGFSLYVIIKVKGSPPGTPCVSIHLLNMF